MQIRYRLWLLRSLVLLAAPFIYFEIMRGEKIHANQSLCTINAQHAYYAVCRGEFTAQKSYERGMKYAELTAILKIILVFGHFYC